MTKTQHAVSAFKTRYAISALLEEHGIAAVVTALLEEMGGTAVQGLAPDETREWNAALARLEELAQKIE